MATAKRYPFKFLDAYTREDAAFFFGREEEIEALYAMVFQTDLILVHGASGTGKTSLIQCGLASKFQPYDWLALNVRRGKDLNASLGQALREAGGSLPAGDALDWLDEWDGETPAPAAARPAAEAQSPVAQRLKAIYLRHFKPLYLIFDQFEELYILGTKAEQQQFIATVRDILRVEQPVKVILSIREEYLGHLYEFERAVPELLRKKLRVEPMNLERVKTVILGVGSRPEGNVRLEAGHEAAIAEGIFDKIRGQDKSLHIPLPYLQVFLDKFYLKVAGDESRQAEATFTRAALHDMSGLGDVLRNFLDEQAAAISRAEGLPEADIWRALSPFVTLEGTKEPLSEAQLAARLHGLPAGAPSRLLQAFVRGRILRFSESSQLYEIAHDALAKQIHARRSDEEIAILEVQRLVKSQAAMKAEAREHFTEKQLLFMAPYLEKFTPSAEESSWIAESRAAAERQKEAAERRQREELEKAQRQAEQEKRLREEAEQNARRARQRTRIAAVVSFFAIALAFFAWFSYSKATQANADVVRLNLQNAGRDILNLRYEDALEKIKAAASLGTMKPNVAAAFLEIAFWHGEAGNTRRATALLDSAAALTNKKAAHLQPFRASIEAFDPAVYKRMMERYYPVMVKVEGGIFDMGCDPGEACAGLHPQEVSSFQISKYETTWWQYYLFCQATGHKYESPGWSTDGDNPAVNVSWFDAVLYLNWAGKQFGLDTFYVVENKREGPWGDYYDVTLDSTAQKGFRLPTEAEWEYAAKGGKHPDRAMYSGHNDIDSVAWHSGNSGSRTHPVGELKANALDLYDMSGNVWEWCWDWYDDYQPNPHKDYTGPPEGSNRVIRGGSWNRSAEYCRVAYRSRYSPDYRNYRVGFRLAFVP